MSIGCGKNSPQQETLMSGGTTQAGVVIFIVWRNMFFLILRDDKPDILFPNTWCPVTGGREENESLFDAALRELTEEISFVPNDFTILGVSHKGNGFFFCRLNDDEREKIVLGEGQGYSFVSWNDLGNHDISGAMKIYLEKYPEEFRAMAETECPPLGSALGLATWNGKH